MLLSDFVSKTKDESLIPNCLYDETFCLTKNNTALPITDCVF
jgi:hypothetical protein